MTASLTETARKKWGLPSQNLALGSSRGKSLINVCCHCWSQYCPSSSLGSWVPSRPLSRPHPCLQFPVGRGCKYRLLTDSGRAYKQVRGWLAWAKFWLCGVLQNGSNNTGPKTFICNSKPQKTFAYFWQMHSV